MNQLKEVEQTYTEARTSAKERSVFTLRWEYRRLARVAKDSTDPSTLVHFAALRDEMIARGESLS